MFRKSNHHTLYEVIKIMLLLQDKCFKVDRKNIETIYPKLMLKIEYVQKGVNNILSHSAKVLFLAVGISFWLSKTFDY